MSDEATSAVRRFFDGMNSHDLDEVSAVAAEDIKFVDMGSGEETNGRDEWRSYCARYTTGFSDIHLEPTNLITAGDMVVVEAVGHGTHDGPLAGPEGEVPATGRRIEVPFCMLFRVRNGQIAESREYYSPMTMMIQLGLMPQPA